MDANHLKSISLFAPLTDDDRQTIAALASELSVPEGKVLVQEGDYAYELMAIKRMQKRSPEAMDRLNRAIRERRPPAATQAG